MKDREKETSNFMKLKFRFLSEISSRGPVSLKTALLLKSEIPELASATGFCPLKALNNLLELGYIKYHSDTNRFTSIEANPSN